jgi:hypothetical protein
MMADRFAGSGDASQQGTAAAARRFSHYPIVAPAGAATALEITAEITLGGLRGLI